MIRSTDKLWGITKLYNANKNKIDYAVLIKFRGSVIKQVFLTDEEEEMLVNLGVIKKED